MIPYKNHINCQGTLDYIRVLRQFFLFSPKEERCGTIFQYV